MKNEIGRKLTSLTIMAIMFAGGMAIGVPSFMPEAASDLSTTEGLLTVSSTSIQGAAVLEIVVNDPDNSSTSDDIQTLAASFGGTSYDLTQGSNGKWYLYIVDNSASTALDADGTGWEFGIECSSGLGQKATTSDLIVSGSHEVWASALAAVGEANVTSGTSAGGCLDIDNMRGTFDDASTTVVRQLLTDNILAGAPSLSNPGGDKTNLGQNYHALNESGHGSWPYIISVDFTDDNEVAYGSDAINVVYGNTDGETGISLTNQNPSAGSEVHLQITDPGLNIDPTTADVWIFDLSDNGGAASTVIFGTNGTNTAMSAAELGDHACGENCQLSSDSETQLASGTTGSTTDGTVDAVQMTETGSNTGVFESFGSNGNAEFEIKANPTINDKTVFSYAGNSVDMIITYHDASISLDNGGGAWGSTSSATITVTDADMNKNSVSAETLSTGDPNAIVPYIKMGSPLTLPNGYNTNLKEGKSAANAGVQIGDGSISGQSAGIDYTLTVTNASGGAERLQIINSAINSGSGTDSGAAMTKTWINVTTGHTRADITGLAGQVFLSYDISGPAGSMSSTDIDVYVTDSGDNGTNQNRSASKTGIIDIVTAGNVQSGVYDLCGSVGFGCLQDVDTDSVTTWDGGDATCLVCGNGTSLVTVNFLITHAAGNQLSTTEDFAISADFCNFDQNNGSLTHNCIYRLNAVETGADTGVFTGAVEYVNLVNSTAGLSGGSHAGGSPGAGDLITTNGDALVVALNNAVSGSDSVRVVYNDTDGFKVATKIGAQLETSTVTGSISFDSDNYGVGDVGTITIVDSDLNQDSSTRDTYTNSTTTFISYIYKSGDTTKTQPFANLMTVIETEADSGVFVGSFIVPDRLGADMKLTYYEARDANGSAVTYETNATISSNSGTVELDRSVYPVPYVSGELNTGAGTASVNTEGGPVTVWITVTDADETSDTFTSGGITVSHVEGSTTSECFTAGGSVAADGVSNTTAAEAGPLSETSIGSQTYEVSISVTESLICASADVTVQSGDVLQVKYVDAASDNGLAATTFDSATFDLRTGSLSVDKDVYVMGSDMVITITDPDLNLDSATAESYAMSLIEWDSAADNTELLATSTADNTHTYFSHNPSSLEETGSNTGVFQTVTTLPAKQVSSTGTPEYGEVVTLTYQDVGLSGEDDVAGDTLDIETTFSISNFGAIIELDKAVYNWTDTVYITITAPDHNNNTVAEETIGTAALPLQVTSRAGKMCTSTSGSTFGIGAETGVDTGVFTAEVLLTGYSLGANNNPQSPTVDNVCSASDSTAHKLKMKGQTDGISVSYEYTDSVVVVASASVMFNIAEASWDTSSASAGGSAVISVTDADENIDSGIINSFTVDVFSDSDNGGFSLTLHETDEDTGVFEGTVIFTTDGATSGVNLRVSEGDTVTAEYSDLTLPEPYTDSDSLTLASTLTIGTAFPPLERAPAANARVVDAFGASVAEVSVDQQVQIAADVSNGQSGDQAFAYLVQVQDESGVTVSLAWITGSLTAGQSMSPALSWTPSASGSYTATVFVWESVDNPTALSPTTSVSIDVV